MIRKLSPVKRSPNAVPGMDAGKSSDWGYRAKVGAAHFGAIMTMNLITTVFLHRGETHGSIEVSRPVREAARFGTWLFSGMKPREWVAVHRMHHDETDRPGDPHSPVQQGRFGVPKVFLGNGLWYYKKAAKRIMNDPELHDKYVPRHLEPDRMDKILYDRGWLGQVALFGLFTAIHRKNPKRAAVALGLHSLVVHDVLGLSGGGFVNSVLHRGDGHILKTLVRKPKANKEGRFTVNGNLLSALATVGEASHDNHHVDPSRLRFGEGFLRDIGATVAEGLITVRLAKKGRGPRIKV